MLNLYIACIVPPLLYSHSDNINNNINHPNDDDANDNNNDFSDDNVNSNTISHVLAVLVCVAQVHARRAGLSLASLSCTLDKL